MQTGKQVTAKSCSCVACTAASTSQTIQTHISLRDKNWFFTGGPALFFGAPTNELEFQKHIQFAQKHQLPICILGQGANVLISDSGFNGLVIQPHLTDIVLQEAQELVTAQAGATIADLIAFC